MNPALVAEMLKPRDEEIEELKRQKDALLEHTLKRRQNEKTDSYARNIIGSRRSPCCRRVASLDVAVLGVDSPASRPAFVAG